MLLVTNIFSSVVVTHEQKGELCDVNSDVTRKIGDYYGDDRAERE